MSRSAIILAAGKGTRMKSGLPKVLHNVGGRAMIDWSIDLAEQAGCTRIIVVVSPDSDALSEHVTMRLGSGAVAVQSPALGTGHAVLAARQALGSLTGQTVVLYGDTPLIPVESVQSAFDALGKGAGLAVLGFENPDPGAYGRLIESENGTIARIVEAKDASPEEYAVTLCNSGVMAGHTALMFDLLEKVGNDNANGEYYLTDLVGLANEAGERVEAVRCPMESVMGVNSRSELAAAEAAFQRARRSAFMAEGVTLTSPETVFFSWDTRIGNDVIIEPNVVFGEGVKVAPDARIRAFSHLEGCEVGEACEIGPYARLRPGTVLSKGVRIGNFVEVKNTRVDEGAKANHLSYLGDGFVGAGANIGAGTIFCNYDGFLKHRTEVGEGAFIGSNSALVAPVTIGAGAMVASGSVITEDVPPDALALGRARQIEKPGYAKTFRQQQAKRKAEGGA